MYDKYIEMFLNFVNRLKSWPVWLAIASLVTFCVKEFGGVDISETVDGLLNVLLPVLIAFGVINNPTDHKHF
jgi:uncharacterized membrane protein